MSLFTDFIFFDQALASRGVPPLGSWWREGLRAWFDSYEQGEALELWACVGRGAAKSTLVYKLALFFALFGTFAIPPGERHYAVCLSRLKEEAGKAITIIASWLRLLSIKHRVAGDTIELEDRPTGIRVVAASVSAASGWRAFFVACDEFSKWSLSEGVEELNSSEIRSSAIAMTATHPNAPNFTLSSAWGAFGEFFDVISQGSTPSRVVLGPAPTWVATDGRVTREECQKKEPDSRRFRREYACEFQAGTSAAFDGDAIDAAFNLVPTGTPAQPVLIIDAASGGADDFTWCSCRWWIPQLVYEFVTRPSYIPNCDMDPKDQSTWLQEPVTNLQGEPLRNEKYNGPAQPVLELSDIDAVPGGFWGKVSGSRIMDRICLAARKAGAKLIIGDQRERMALQSGFQERGFSFTSLDWTSQSKPLQVERARTLMREGRLTLAHQPKLRAELVSFQEKLTPSGALTYGARSGRHDDRVALLLTACLADLSGLLPESPHARRGSQIDLSVLGEAP